MFDIKEYQRAWYLRNKWRYKTLKVIERKNKYNKEYYHKNKKRLKIKVDKWRKQNSERVKLRNNEWSKTLKGKFNGYKHRSKFKNIPWGLSFDEFQSFWQKPCYYCGDKIETVGLDRVNNEKGYSFKNIVSCCKVCNYMKLEMSQKEFLEQCKKIVKKQFDE